MFLKVQNGLAAKMMNHNSPICCGVIEQRVRATLEGKLLAPKEQAGRQSPKSLGFAVQLGLVKVGLDLARVPISRKGNARETSGVHYHSESACLRIRQS